VKLLLGAIALAVATFLIVSHARTKVCGDLSVQPGHLKEAILQQTGACPNEVQNFFASDLLFIIGYLSVFVAAYALARSRAHSPATLGVVLAVAGAIVDAAGDILCIKYASKMPESTLRVVTNVKWTLLLTAALILMMAFLRRTLSATNAL